MTDHDRTTENITTVVGHSISTDQGDLDITSGGDHFHISICPHGTDIGNMATLCLTAMEMRTLQELIKVTLKAQVTLSEERARSLIIDRVKAGLRNPEDGNPFVFGADLSAFLGRPPKRRPDGSGEHPAGQGGAYL
jgi:hypothetical protein